MEKYLKYGFYLAAAVAVYFTLKKLGIFKSRLEREGEKNIADTTTKIEIAEAKQNATKKIKYMQRLSS